MTTSNRRTSRKRKIDSYSHKDKERANNPPVGLVDPKTDPDRGEKETYQYDPHIDPQLQWAGKAERTSFEVPTVSLHVHERIDPRTIMETVCKKNGNDNRQSSLFEEERDAPLRDAIEFYKHSNNWSNRLIAGDSLLVMNSMIQKENMAGEVQCVYIDPPYGIKYGSNFQPFVNKRDVKDGKGEDLTAEPEQIRAFGPEHAPMEQRQVENALQEAGNLRPKPKIIIFAAFQFDPEAAKDIDETNWPGMTLLKAQMNADMQTADLKKNRSSNESFWLIGQPDVSVEQIRKGAYIG